MIMRKRKKTCPFKTSGFKDIDYKNIETLKLFVTERGKLLPSRITGTSCRFQRLLKKACKKARYMALLPFVEKE